MLSILIPVYNVSVVTLVEALQTQCQTAAIPYEICCFDDGSAASYRKENNLIKSMPKVRYIELEENLGRSRIRNALAAAARYDYLLFMDGDSAICRDNYIQQYCSRLSSELVIVGSTAYSITAPQNPSSYLRWYYGCRREQLSVKIRSQNPYHAFRTHHFIIPAKVFQSIRFDESLLQYGHEDTIFGLELKSRQVPILHIDNPLEHIGLESTPIFLEKSQRAVRNLYELHQKGSLIDTRLLRLYKRSKRLHIDGLFALLFNLLESLIVKNLYSRHPSLWLFDFYKLGYLIRESRKKEEKTTIDDAQHA